jgi:hypothetical protein
MSERPVSVPVIGFGCRSREFGELRPTFSLDHRRRGVESSVPNGSPTESPRDAGSQAGASPPASVGVEPAIYPIYFVASRESNGPVEPRLSSPVYPLDRELCEQSVNQSVRPASPSLAEVVGARELKAEGHVFGNQSVSIGAGGERERLRYLNHIKSIKTGYIHQHYTITPES